jgi:deazaflavin-dependent oxidoreductase (nitroreductase family)
VLPGATTEQVQYQHDAKARPLRPELVAGGTAVNPAWYYNMAAHPDKVQIEVDGRKVAVAAGQLYGAERAEAWQQITATSLQFARFQQKTDRKLPVIHLTPDPAPRLRNLK